MRKAEIQHVIDAIDLAPLAIRVREEPMKDVISLEISLQIYNRNTLSAEAIANMDDRTLREWIDFSIRRTLPDICDILAQVYHKMRLREGAKQWGNK